MFPREIRNDARTQPNTTVYLPLIAQLDAVINSLHARIMLRRAGREILKAHNVSGQISKAAIAFHPIITPTETIDSIQPILLPSVV